MRGTRTIPLTVAGLGALLVVLLGTLLLPGRARAHTDLESSTPADGSSVDAPVAEITLVFTEAVTVVEGGFEVLDPAGQVRMPDAVDSPDGGVSQVLRFATPLGGGDVGLRWSVAADDGHIVEGTLRFTVTAPVPTTTTTAPAPSTTAVPPTTAAVAPATIETTAGTSAATSSTAAPTTSPSTGEPAAAPTTTAAPMSIEQFLGGDGAGSVDLRWHRAAQVLVVVSAILAAGLVAFAVGVGRATPDATAGLPTAAFVAGVVLAGASVLEAASHAGVVTARGLGVIGDPGDVFDAVTGSYLVAIALRFAGGLVVAVGMLRWGRGAGRRAAWGAVTAAAAGAVVVSFAFDGHTVSQGNRAVQTVADVIHVGAAALWVGGVIALTSWAWRRRRDTGGADAERFLALLLRFSGVATWALVAVAGAGVAMALGILDGPSELTSTTWGRWLIAKVAAVAVAVAIGAYNRFRLLPALNAAPRSAEVHERVRDALAAEAFLLLVAAVVAGFLVGAMV